MIDPQSQCAPSNHFECRRSVCPVGPKHEPHGPVQLCSGSRYTGNWSRFGMHGPGQYTMPDGVVFDGTIKEGQFHGAGKLIYPNGNIVEGEWDHGISSNLQLTFADGLRVPAGEWNYCSPGGCRRFYPDEVSKLAAIGMHRSMPNHMKTCAIPADCYHTGKAFYNIKSKCLYSLFNPKEMIGYITKAEEEWIVSHCPSSASERVGFREDLLEPNAYTYPNRFRQEAAHIPPQSDSSYSNQPKKRKANESIESQESLEEAEQCTIPITFKQAPSYLLDNFSHSNSVISKIRKHFIV